MIKMCEMCQHETKPIMNDFVRPEPEEQDNTYQIKLLNKTKERWVIV